MPIRVTVRGQTIAILNSGMTDAEAQMELAPMVTDKHIYIPTIKDSRRNESWVTATLLASHNDLVVVGYWMVLQFLTVGIWWDGWPRCWGELPDEVRARIRAILMKWRLSTRDFPYESEAWAALEALECLP